MSSSSPYHLGTQALIGYLAFLSAFAPISTDLYLPALPGMAHQLQTSPEIINLTLSGFFLIFALSMLIWGPLSDKYGRKPILYIGSGLYILSSLGCAFAGTAVQLIGARALQALASGALSGVAMTVVKDVFKGKLMENVLTAIQTITVLAPLLAPLLGGFLLHLTSWRGCFWVLGGCGATAFGGALFLQETLQDPLQGSALHSLTRIIVVLRHRGFRSLLLVFSAAIMGFMAYLATSSYIYQEIFHITPGQFSYFFAANAGVSLLGPLVYIRFLRDISKRRLMACAFSLIAVCGGLLLIAGHASPFSFALLYLPITACGSAIRPASTMLMMQQLDSDNGTVASLIGSTGLLFGCLSMLLCSLPFWPSFIVAAGSISLISGTLCCIFWLHLDTAHAFRRQP